MANKGRSGNRQGLKARVFRAGGFSLADMGVTYVFRFASNLILTQLLLPEAFGLMAMVTTLHAALFLFTDIGIRQSIIRDEKGADTTYLQVAWTVQLLRGWAVGGIVFLIGASLLVLGSFAPPDSVYADERLPGLVMLSGLVPAFLGGQSTNMWLAERELRQSRVLLFNLIGRTVGLCTMVSLALIVKSVWALVIGLVLGQAFRMVLSHWIMPGPRMRFLRDAEQMAGMWRFGRWLMGASALTFVARNADRFILGALLDKQMFGFYVIAMLWIEALAAVGNKLIDRVGLSVFSDRVRKEPKALVKSYVRFGLVIDCIVGFCWLFAFFAVPLLIGWLYRPAYAEAGAMIPFLSIYILAQRFKLPSMLLLAKGRSPQMMITSGINALAVVIFLQVGYSLGGLNGALLGAGLAPLSAAPYLIMISRSTLGKLAYYDVAWFISILLASAYLGSQILI